VNEVRGWPEAALREGRIRYNRLLPARAGDPVDWAGWVGEEVRAAWARGGITRPWRHQMAAAQAVWAGRHVALTTGTASGKSLGYLLPILATTYAGLTPGGTRVDDSGGGWRQRPHTALYLAPTKALAHDQHRACADLGLDRWRIAAVDGDTPPDERDWARDYATFVLTNPDLLHHGVLPSHPRWRGLLQSLRYVVIDEAHRYRGVFGAQVAGVLRRLRRLAAHYGADPRFVLASATTIDAATTAEALLGIDRDEFEVVDSDTSARGAVEVGLWQPEASAEDDAADLLAEFVGEGRQTIAFVASRRLSEVIARRAQARLDLRAGTRVDRRVVEAYRGGYLASDRRRLEADLHSGALRGVAATNALELGVDIAGVDAVVMCGYPGSRAAWWQQTGRAGRRGRDAKVVLVARRQPLDAYLLEHPELIFDAPVEAVVLHPDNPHVLGPQLAAAAQELPITEADRAFFGEPGLALTAQLVHRGVLRQRPGGCYWTRPERAVDHVDLRSAGGEAIDIVEQETGRVLGHVDAFSADLVVHPGAVYLHLGDSYLCEELDRDQREALVRRERPGYLTQPQLETSLRVVGERRSRPLGVGRVHLGEVEVASRVTGYLRRDEVSGQVWDSTPLELGERRLSTTAVWWTLDPAELAGSLPSSWSGLAEEWSDLRLDAGVHAAEHLCLALLPVFAPCDRYDLGAVSAVRHPQTQQLTVVVHDQQPGGTGFADRAYAVADAWVRAALARVSSCDCELGCPACILSVCGSNRPLDKQVATQLLGLLAG
jgi:DEAD/DEAH box helicase domain-containing protein